MTEHIDNKTVELKSKKSSKAKLIEEKLLSFDKFSQPLQMTFDGGKTSLATWTGTILSLILITVVTAYFV